MPHLRFSNCLLVSKITIDYFYKIQFDRLKQLVCAAKVFTKNVWLWQPRLNEEIQELQKHGGKEIILATQK